MSWMRSLRVMALAALLLLPNAAEAATKVLVWHAYRAKEKEALETVVKAYNAKQAGVVVELMPIPFDAFPDKITAAIPRDKGPDLFIFAQDRIGDWAASGVIEPIDFWADDKLRGSFLEPTIEALTYDDALYGLPMACKMVALFYNKKLVSAPPKTTDELIALAKKLTDAKAGKYGFAYQNADFWYHGAWMNGFGGRVFDRKKNPTLDTKEVIDSMAFAQKLAHQAGIMPQEISSTLVTSLFNQGKVAMVINGPWFIGELDPKLDFGVAVLPTISSLNKSPMPFLSAEAVIMSAKAKDKKAAFEVMKHLTGVEAGTTMALVGRQPVARREVYDQPKVKGDALLSVFREQLRHTVPTPNSPAMKMVWSPATTAINKVVNGKADPAAAMKTAQAEVIGFVKGARK